MFGRMSMQMPTCKLQSIRSCERPSKPMSFAWIEYSKICAAHPISAGGPESGAVYILDRKNGSWYSIDFDDKQCGGYSVSQLEHLLEESALATWQSVRAFSAAV